jgi:hypothetical protein
LKVDDFGADRYIYLLCELFEPMHNVQKDWIGATVIAALGAGVITSFAVSQGQNPFVGLGITLFAAISAVAIDHFL